MVVMRAKRETDMMKMCTELPRSVRDDVRSDGDTSHVETTITEQTNSAGLV